MRKLARTGLISRNTRLQNPLKTRFSRSIKTLAVVGCILLAGIYGFSRFDAQWRIHNHYDEPLATWLPTAGPVVIQYVPDHRDWLRYSQRHYARITPIYVAELDPHLLHLLRASNGFHSAPTGSLDHGGFVVSVWRENRTMQPHLYVYIAETGELGREHEWCYVPAEFKAWMKTLKPPT